MTNDHEVTDVTRETYTLYDKATRQDIKVKCVFGTYEKSGTLRVRLYCQTPGKMPGVFSTLYKELTVEDSESSCLEINCQFLTDIDSILYKRWLRSNNIANLTCIADKSVNNGFIEAFAFNLPLDIYRRVCLDRRAKCGRDSNPRLLYPMRFRSWNIPEYSILDMRTFLRKKLNSILKARLLSTLMNTHKTLLICGYVHPLLEGFDYGAFRKKYITFLGLKDIYISLGANISFSMFTHITERRYREDRGKRAIEVYRRMLEMAVREMMQQIDDNYIDRTAISDYIENHNDFIKDITFNKKRLHPMSIFRFKYKQFGLSRSARMIVLKEGKDTYTPVVPVSWENPEWKVTVKDTWRALADPDRIFHITKINKAGDLLITEPSKES